ncbi:MAG: serine hydrolase domain-containing protein [Aureispira sp.]
MKTFLFLIAISISTVLVHCKKDNLPTTAQELTETVEEDMAVQHISGLAFIITKGNQILVERYLGQADRRLNKAVEENTLFLLASISKTVTATALMQLYEQDSFELDDPINNYLGFAVQPPNTTTPITFRMLLQHTAGIADGGALDDEYFWGQDSPNDLSVFLENYFTPGTSSYDANANFTGEEPGTQHDYSNVGAALVGHLVEAITGIPFDVYCQQYIFTPLCMNSSSWRLQGLDTSRIAQPYTYNNRAYEAIGHYTFTDYPNGGLRTTARDLARFMIAYQQGGQFNNQVLLNNSTVNLMLTETLVDQDNGIGLHWFTYDRAVRNLWGHDGAEQGTTTMMGFNPSTGVGIVVLCNATDANLDAVSDLLYDFGQHTTLTGNALGC